MTGQIDTDYLIIGAGAAGMAFADTILDETDAHVTIVDRQGRPGGHWNDAYSFVTLHQPSAFYGVNSTPLGSGRKDSHGANAGLYELASGAEVSGYYDAVMRRRLLPTGRVTWLPMSDYRGEGRVVSLLSGDETRVNIRRKTVDATYGSPTIPAHHRRVFAVADGVRIVPPGALTGLWREGGARPEKFVVVGAGKTAMDTIVWLVDSGAAPDAIQWIKPRESWLLDRTRTQPGIEFFDEVFSKSKTETDELIAEALRSERWCTHGDRGSYVLVRREPFLALAKRDGLEPIWTVIGERRATTLKKKRHPDDRVRYNGLLWLAEGEEQHVHWSNND